MERWKIVFETDNGMPNYYWGSLMHGMLMEYLEPGIADQLHSEELHTFSQWVEPINAKSFCWHLNMLDDALTQIMPDLSQGREFDLKHVPARIRVSEVTRESLSFSGYMKPFFMREAASQRIRMRFITTTTHKTQGNYAIFPAVDMIASGLRRKILLMDPENVLGDDEVIRQIVERTMIVRYRLQSSAYSMEGRWIHGYTGTIDLSVKGPDALVRLADVLYGFAPYCGVGIKTALGMGACEAVVEGPAEQK